MTRRLWTTLAHLAVPLGLYQAAGVAAIAQVAGVPTVAPRIGARAWLFALAYSYCVGMGVYLLDRVKLKDAWLDPADAIAQPARATFIAKHATGVRWLMAAVLLVGATTGTVISWWLVPMLLAACTGVVVYAGRPRGERARPKDLLIIKNACVAIAMTGFASVVVWMTAGPFVLSAGALADGHATGLSLAAAVLALFNVFVRVLSDAVICDLEDESADRAFATATLATWLGRERAWNVASATRLALGAVLVFWSLASKGHVGRATPALVWGVVTIASTLVTRAVRPTNLRDWVDWRFPAEAIAVTAWLTLGAT